MYLQKINLKNKYALVTGAGKGLGRACSIALAQAGATVIALSSNPSYNANLSSSITTTAPTATNPSNGVEKIIRTYNLILDQFLIFLEKITYARRQISSSTSQNLELNIRTYV